MDLNFILSWVATVTTIATNFSHIPTCLKIKRKGSTSEYSCFPSLCMLSSATLWLKYGLLMQNQALIIVNTTAVFLNAIFLAFYYSYTLQKSHLHRKLLTAFVLVTSLLSYIKFFTEDEETAAVRLGSIGTCFTIVSYGSPLSAVADVIRTKSTECMPFALTCANLIVSIEWVAYGYVLGDYFIEVPNFIGFLFCTIQLLLFVIYPSKSQGPIVKA